MPLDTPLELLAPAGNLECGLVALSAGADAIYVGAPKFGARASAGVSLADIETLVVAAHTYGARVYVALNTILYDHELREAELLIRRLYLMGVDALIVQDMGLLALDLPPIALHASTQCHNASIEQVKHLASLGFEQVVLARELSVEETKEIHQGVPQVCLETFVHGALCVSYSGRCYLSQKFSSRSANRGACAQHCRLPYTLVDASGVEILKEQHLLSLKDLNRSSILSQLIGAGAVSFKIEGRLKSASYVRNVTAYYHRLLDDFINTNPGSYRRASCGEVNLSFEPHLEKSFSRGFTTFQISKGPCKEAFIRPESPKSEGEYLGVITAVKGKEIQVKPTPLLANGDGLAFYTIEGTMLGTRVNTVLRENTFTVDNPKEMRVGMKLYRNYSIQFEREINRPNSSIRTLPITMALKALPWGVILTLSIKQDRRPLEVKVSLASVLEPAHGKVAVECIVSTLSKLGGSGFATSEVKVESNGLFIPLSILGSIKKQGLEALNRALRLRNIPKPSYRPSYDSVQLPRGRESLSSEANIANFFAEKVYRSWGANELLPTYELAPQDFVPLMTCRHCIRRYIGYCSRSRQAKSFPYQEPLYLIHGKNRIRLEFDCALCQMKLFAVT